MDITSAAKRAYATSLEALNDTETVALHQPGVSGAVLRDWLAGEPLRPGADSFLLPEHASLGQAVEELRRISGRLARVVGLVVAASRHPQDESERASL